MLSNKMWLVNKIKFNLVRYLFHFMNFNCEGIHPLNLWHGIKYYYVKT